MAKRQDVSDEYFVGIIVNLNKLDMIRMMDVCEIGRISFGSIEGVPIENKITALSHCIGD